MFSESSKFLSQFAFVSDYNTCYDIFYHVAECIIQILQTQPHGIGPPKRLCLVTPEGVKTPSKLLVIADDIECVQSEWNVMRNRSGLRVLTTKLSPSMTRWPLLSSVGTIKAGIEAIYRSIARADVFKKVDEFCGDSKVINYVELATEKSSTVFEESGRNILLPSAAPLFIKYQEMKSVWPVQPRDYLAGQTGFDLVVEDDGRRGKFLISKSIDPHPQDPYPAGHEGFVRGALTASAFLIIENADCNQHSDVWTFLHCDMKGSLSGNGKIADFILQNQMPKFFAKLETVAIEQQLI